MRAQFQGFAAHYGLCGSIYLKSSSKLNAIFAFWLISWVILGQF